MKVIVTDEISEQGLMLLKADPRLQLDVRLGLTKAELSAVIGQYDAIITRSGTQVDAKLLSTASRLKIIARAGVGIDNVDVPAASERGIIVVNAPFGNTNSAAEHTMAILLALCRNVPDANMSLKSGAWQRAPFTGHELRHKTMGIIGLGKVGSRVALRAKAFEMEVIVYDPYISEKRASDFGTRLVDLQTLVATADVISVHTPLNDETENLIHQDHFELMKQGVLIVNCARGGIINEQAMLAALDNGKVGGGAFDVWSGEPPQTEILKKLIAHPKMLVTPHLGANTFEAQTNVAVDVSREILNLIDGKPIENAVNIPRFDADLMSQMRPFMTLAEVLGDFISQLAPENPGKVSFHYTGKLADHDCMPITVAGLAALLNRCTDQEVNMVNASLVAERHGLVVEQSRSTESEFFSNLITLDLESPEGKRTIAGTLFEGMPKIVKMRDFATDFTPEEHMLVMTYEDRPGLIGKIGTILGDAGVNIGAMNLGRRAKGGEAMVVFSVDTPVDELTLTSLSDSVGCHFIKAVNLTLPR
ncbi:MAG: phosphoglycerate dehydrogenase [Deltaproteobacteria bacterium]|nr:phosphoglycerate dehydrogenase [Deltaproteobacteria bacterium]MBW2503817.1 phosphoglycerate dehydrogenase [Deltaproteobacteria bacterium]